MTTRLLLILCFALTSVVLASADDRHHHRGRHAHHGPHHRRHPLKGHQRNLADKDTMEKRWQEAKEKHGWTDEELELKKKEKLQALEEKKGELEKRWQEAKEKHGWTDEELKLKMKEKSEMLKNEKAELEKKWQEAKEKHGWTDEELKEKMKEKVEMLKDKKGALEKRWQEAKEKHGWTDEELKLKMKEKFEMLKDEKAELEKRWQEAKEKHGWTDEELKLKMKEKHEMLKKEGAGHLLRLKKGHHGHHDDHEDHHEKCKENEEKVQRLSQAMKKFTEMSETGTWTWTPDEKDDTEKPDRRLQQRQQLPTPSASPETVVVRGTDEVMALFDLKPEDLEVHQESEKDHQRSGHKHKHSRTAMIVGAAVGGVGALAAAFLLGSWFGYRRGVRQQQVQVHEHQAANVVMVAPVAPPLHETELTGKPYPDDVSMSTSNRESVPGVYPEF